MAALCPPTQASLGDGIDGADYLAAGGRFGIGTDSNIQIDAAAELRQLEYSQRLRRRARNVMTLQEGESTGRRLLPPCWPPERRRCSGRSARSPRGSRADVVVLDGDHPISRRARAIWLDAWIFVAGKSAVSGAGGRGDGGGGGPPRHAAGDRALQDRSR